MEEKEWVTHKHQIYTRKATALQSTVKLIKCRIN